MINSDSCVKWTNYENDEHPSYAACSNFFYYAALNWGDHFRLAGMKLGNPILPFVLRICDPSSKSYASWFLVSLVNWAQKKQPTSLVVASYLGHSVTATLMLSEETMSIQGTALAKCHCFGLPSWALHLSYHYHRSAGDLDICVAAHQ